MTLQKAYEDFLTDCKFRLAKPTVHDYKLFIGYFFADVDVNFGGNVENEITKEKYERYALGLRKRAENGEITTVTVNTYLRPVRRLINYLIERELVLQFKTRLIRQSAEPKPTLSESDIQLIFENIDPYNMSSVIVMLLAITAARSRSIRELRVRDIDFHNLSITLRETKNGRPLTLPIDERAVTIIKAYCHINNRSGNDFLFVTGTGKCFDEHDMYKRVTKFLHSIGVNKQGVHIFRHTVAKQFVLRGMDAITLQHWLGHKSVAQSAAYVSLYADDLRRNFDKYNLFKQ